MGGKRATVLRLVGAHLNIVCFAVEFASKGTGDWGGVGVLIGLARAPLAD